MQWVRLHISRSPQDYQLLYSKYKKVPILCLIIGMLFIVPACKENEHVRELHADNPAGELVKKNNINNHQYIIVVSDISGLISALNSLKKYDAKQLRDLGSGRYLIELKLDPGIDQLKMDVEKLDSIDFIQPNYKYELQ